MGWQKWDWFTFRLFSFQELHWFGLIFQFSQFTSSFASHWLEDIVNQPHKPHLLCSSFLLPVTAIMDQVRLKQSHAFQKWPVWLGRTMLVWECYSHEHLESRLSASSTPRKILVSSGSDFYIIESCCLEREALSMALETVLCRRNPHLLFLTLKSVQNKAVIPRNRRLFPLLSLTLTIWPFVEVYRTEPSTWEVPRFFQFCTWSLNFPEIGRTLLFFRSRFTLTLHQTSF